MAYETLSGRAAADELITRKAHQACAADIFLLVSRPTEGR
jgi:hypothetical protein